MLGSLSESTVESATLAWLAGESGLRRAGALHADRQGTAARQAGLPTGQAGGLEIAPGAAPFFRYMCITTETMEQCSHDLH